VSDAEASASLALDHNAVIAASAGTGKTHLITNVYLALVLGLGPDRRPVPAERIAATTFSRAAAREIRERLEQRLSVLSGEARIEGVVGLDSLLEQLVRERDLSARELARRASRALEELPRAFIDTLHGLATRIVRTHALALELSPGFTILDENAAFEDAEATLDEVLVQALEEPGEMALAARALVDAAYGLDGTRAALMNLLGLLDEEGIDASALSDAPHLADAASMSRTIAEAARAVQAGGRTHPLSAPAQEVLSALGIRRDFAALERGLSGLLKDRRPQLEKYQGGSALVGLLDETLLRPKASKADRIRASVRFLAGAEALSAEARGIAALLARAQRVLRQRRIARGQLGFSDVLWLSRHTLLQRPDLQIEVGETLDALLVDEFQDTSRVQRDLLLLLWQTPEAARRRRPGDLPDVSGTRPRGLVVVGDRKQSIYAFRGADVSVYARLAAELAGKPAADALDLRGVRPSTTPVAKFAALTRNFRSAPGILRFVNRVAQRDFAAEPRHAYEIRYTDHEALVPGRAGTSAGRVTLIEVDGAESSDPLLARAEGGLLTAFTVAGFCARAQGQGTAFSQIAILARRRATLPLLELALDRFGVPFVVAGRALYATPEIRDLAALLRVALDPYDRHALVVVARSPLGGLSDPALVGLSDPGRGLLPARRWQADGISEPRERALVLELKERLLELSELASRLSPRDLLSFAVERFELESVLGGLPRGPGRFGNVGRLLEIAARHGGSTPRFSRWLERQITLEVDESEAAVFSEADDAVRLLTIHGSKGLAFDVTVIADAEAVETTQSPPLGLLRHDDGSVELLIRHRGPEGNLYTPLMGRAAKDARSRANAERQRLSYVALTRARHELCIALPAKARTDSLAASIRSVLEAGELDDDPAVVRLSGRSLLGAVPALETSREAPLVVPRRPLLPLWRGAAVGVTALADFTICARRFQLLHVLGLEEPEVPGGGERDGGDGGHDDARSLGSAAHRLLERFPLERWGTAIDPDELVRELEREGLDPEASVTRETAVGIARFLSSAYAAGTREPGTELHRELEITAAFALNSRGGPGQLELFDRSSDQRALIKATLDLVVERPDGSLDVLDYKRTRGGDSRRYALQLSAYASVCRERFGQRNLRVGLVHLLGRSPEPEWLLPEPHDLSGLVSNLVRRRYSGEYPPVPPARCRSARCGFLDACHGPSARATARPRLAT
jgi:ATP-dependent helicase/nuclease subunit A